MAASSGLSFLRLDRRRCTVLPSNDALIYAAREGGRSFIVHWEKSLFSRWNERIVVALNNFRASN